MFKDYHYPANGELVRELAASQRWDEAFEELAHPLHEALYEAQSFDFINGLSTIEKLILSLDYVRMQVGQGGLIQLIQNNYTPLLVVVIESAAALNIAQQLRKTLDDALKVFVLNSEALSRETTPEEFGKLYDEFREFEPLDSSFEQELPAALQEIVVQTISM